MIKGTITITVTDKEHAMKIIQCLEKRNYFTPSGYTKAIDDIETDVYPCEYTFAFPSKRSDGCSIEKAIKALSGLTDYMECHF